MNVYEETKFLMKKYGITANKSLGQNFLVDDSVIQNAVTEAGICKDDLVIEIGPGLGTFTNELIKKAAKVICVELDKRMVEILKDRFKFYDNIEIINEDIFKVDINKIVQENDRLKIKIVRKSSILYNNSNYNEAFRKQSKIRKYNCNDTKRSCR